MKLQNIFQWTRYGAVCAATVLLVAACGGGGGEAGTNPNQNGGNKPLTASSIELYSDSSTIQTGSSAAKLTITAIVKDSGNMAIPNIPLVLKTNYGSLSPVTKTNEKGVATAELTPPQSDNKANRVFDIEAVARGATKKIQVTVEGTTLALAGDNTLGIGQAGSYSLQVRDGTNQAIGGAAMQITTEPANAGVVQLKDGFTNSTNTAGTIEFTYTPSQPGAHRILVNGLNATPAQLVVNVGGSAFQFLSGANPVWAINTSNEVSVRIMNSAGAPVPFGTPVRLSTTRGCLVTNPALTACPLPVPLSQDLTADVTGVVRAYAISPDGGPVLIKAERLDESGSGTVSGKFVAVVPSRLILQANPNSIQTSTSATNKTSVIEARILDAGNNPIAGIPVYFTAVQDLSGGSLAVASVVTDQDGIAKNTYNAGSRGTGADGVVIRAALGGGWSYINGTVALTIGGDALTIAISESSDITAVNANTQYNKIHTVYVTNSAGKGVPSQPITVRVQPHKYAQGVTCWNGKVWFRKKYIGSTPTVYDNEDVNFNGIKDPGEVNWGTYPAVNPPPPISEALKPGFIANLLPANSQGEVQGSAGSTVLNLTTDENGFAYFAMRYGKEYWGWVNVELVATARVAGTESRNQTFGRWLPVLTSEVNKEDNTPPGMVSPYGDGGVTCTN